MAHAAQLHTEVSRDQNLFLAPICGPPQVCLIEVRRHFTLVFPDHTALVNEETERAECSPDYVRRTDHRVRRVQQAKHKSKSKFISYAVDWIWQAIGAHVADCKSAARTARSQQLRISAVRRAVVSITAEGRQVTEEEVMKETGCAAESVRLALEHRGGEVSMDAPVDGSTASSTLAEIMGAPVENFTFVHGCPLALTSQRVSTGVGNSTP